ncbi:ATP-binding protein [Actinophytocola xanthii]|uniref:LuxR family transcriptional regulator n=1 Tax=Actinophytocola xanthii TaxID=1912961 RepID=A0A1Q8CJR5_9PSEU|nr:BTAD domain-containing putative transcriptional regulator [Actinophytocola xanthii]OLF14595.1 LuxR family transcriptional regulator [Actinophytocola xanthii]
MTIELALLSRACCRGSEITRPRLRHLFALLADDLRAGASTARLVEELWPDERPVHPAKALQVLVSHARASLGADIIASTPSGYRLSLGPDEVDAAAVLVRLAASVRCARTGDHAAALEHAEAGLALWSTPPEVNLELGDPLSMLRAARASTYRSLVRERSLALSRLDRRAEALELLLEVVGEYPRDEEVLAELLRCEAATVGPAAALDRYEAYRRAVREELGSDPGPALRAVHHQLLQGERPLVRRGVPHEPNALLGRDADVRAVAQLLRTSRVTSIVGAGGLGKTRLAHVVSRRAEQRVVCFVELAGVAGDEDVVHQVASALDVGEPGFASVGRGDPTDGLAGIVNVLAPGPALLVLDNCEHVVAGAAELVRALVAMCADLRVLTTSRAPLGISSESVYLLPELEPATAVELFGQRARAARSGVDLPADVVAQLCGHLDGLPLAVELAAARVRVMSVGEIARGLEDRFALLRGGSRDAPERHRTLHAVIDWSWHLLDAAGRTAMRALSVFPGGFTGAAARHLVGEDALRVVEQLVGQSMLRVSDTGAGVRFRMLETVREFSAARRADAGETEEVTGRFLAWAQAFGLAHQESVFGGELVSTVARIRAEQDNLVLALRYGIDRRDGATVAAASAALAGLWTVESNFGRMATLGEETAWVLSHFRPEPVFVEVTRTAAVLAAVSAFLLHGSGAARSLLTLRRLPQAPPVTMPRALDVVLRAVAPAPDLSALDTLCGSAEPLVAGLANGVVSQLRETADDLEGALAAARRSLGAFERLAVPVLLATAHSRMGELCLRADLPDETRHHVGEILAVVDEVGAWTTAARARWVMVLADLQRGAVDEAERGLDQALRAGADKALSMAMFDVAVRAEILLARGQVEAGLRLWRRVTDRQRRDARPDDGGDWWSLEARAVTVVAHAHHRRLDLVEEIVHELPFLLRAAATVAAPSSYSNFPICGALLLALGMAEVARGQRRVGVRMIALAHRFRFTRNFQPTMSAARATRVAEKADGSAYAEAVSSYADLAPGALRPAAMAALRERELVTASDPS